MSKSPASLAVGSRLPVREIRITQELIDRYAAISGDFNPIHVDPSAGAAAGFGGSIAHGCIPMEPLFQAVQAALGRDGLPRGTKIRLRYLAPSRPGDTIRSEVGITEVSERDGRQHITAAFSCRDQDDRTVLEGELGFEA